MNWIDRFGTKHRRFGIPNLMLYLIATQAFVFIASMISEIPLIAYLDFSRTLILQGEIWRLITFIFIPNSYSLFWFLISCFLYYSLGQSLEQKMGTATFNLYMILGVLGAIIAGLIDEYTTNIYLFRSIFFAYAFFYPDAEINFYLFIPVKVKYFVYAGVIVYGVDAFKAIRSRNWFILIAQALSFVNIFIFFGPTLFDNLKRYGKNKKRRAQFERDMRGSSWGDKDDDIS